MLPSIQRGPWGKPFFPHWPELSFNLIHSGGFALCGVGDHPLGVDIELVRPRREGLSRRILAAGEQEQLAKAADPVKRLIAFWTLKESYGKYTGTGLLGLPLKDRVFSIDPSGGISFCRTECQFVLEEREEFCAALCGDAGEPAPETLIEVSLDVLEQ